MKGRTPAVLAAIAFFAGAGTAHAQFTVEGSPYPTGNAPYNAYAADFNRDGRQDVVTSNGDGQTVSVFLRQAGGGFAEESGSPFSLPGATSNGAAGDFNGDGLTDLAIADFIGTSGVVLALRNGAGGFQRETVSLGGRLSAVGAGDFNGDGRVDLVVAAYDFTQVSVLLRNPGNDGFTLAGNHAVGVQPRQIAVADFSGDGRPDIAVTNELSNSVSILVNTGGGTFASEGTPVAVGTRPSGITAGDFDGDGRTDLAVSNFSDSTVSVLLRTAIGTFTPAAGSPVPVAGGPVSVAGADFDGNGSLDIAVSTITSLDVIRNGAAGFARDTTTPVTTSGSGLALADYNADGRTDAAVSSIGSNLLTVLLSPSPPPTQPPPPQPTPTPTPTPPLDNPQVNREVNVLPVSGTVRIKRRGSSRYVELKAGEQIPNGSSVDARDGRVTIVAAQSGTRVERADFFDGLFTVSQSKRLTTLTLTEQLSCPRGARAAQKKPKSRKLWGDGKGKFRTKGRYSAATIRGTRWLVQDTCTTTRTRVTQGSVNVRDEVRKRTVIVRKGKSYTARARR